jgi:hypothetical protein
MVHGDVTGPAIGHYVVISDDVHIVMLGWSISYQWQDIAGEGYIPRRTPFLSWIALPRSVISSS